MLKLDNTLLDELGLGALPEDQKRAMLQHIYETLELRVGTNLANQMTDAQLDEFEKFIDEGGDANQAQALQWLETNLPNYKQVVNEVFEALKGEVKQMAPQLLSASGLAPGAAPAPAAPAPASNDFNPPAPQPAYGTPAPDGYGSPVPSYGVPANPAPAFGAPAPAAGGFGSPAPAAPAGDPFAPGAPMPGVPAAPASDPFGQPGPAPAPFAPAQPAPDPFASPQPSPFADPFAPAPPAPQGGQDGQGGPQPGQPGSMYPNQQPPAGPGSFPPQHPQQ